MQRFNSPFRDSTLKPKEQRGQMRERNKIDAIGSPVRETTVEGAMEGASVDGIIEKIDNRVSLGTYNHVKLSLEIDRNIVKKNVNGPTPKSVGNIVSGVDTGNDLKVVNVRRIVSGANSMTSIPLAPER
jgi:hypothetical protein